MLKVANVNKAIEIERNKGVVLDNTFYQLKSSYPNAKTPELRLYFDAVLNNSISIDTLQTKLKMVNDISFAQSYEIAQTDIDCTNPLPINDVLVINGTYESWAIERIHARCAWNITTGNPNIVIGMADTDFEPDHEDLVNQFSQVTGIVSAGNNHGTLTSGVADAEVNNNKGIAGIGYNSKVAGYRVKHTITSTGGATASSNDIKDAIWAAYLDGRPVINASGQGQD